MKIKHFENSMTKICLFTLFLLTSLFAQSQELKTKKKIVRHNRFFEKYSVLKSDKTTKHGEYKMVTHNTAKLIENGNYVLDKKVGLWEYYDYNIHTKKLELEQKYDYTNNKLIFNRNNDSDYDVFINGKWIQTKLDTIPIYLGGYRKFYNQVIEFVDDADVPKIATLSKVNGNVIATFIVDEKGETSDYKIELGVGGECDRLVLNSVRKVSNDWSPAILNGNKVKTKIIVIINFKYWSDGSLAVVLVTSKL
ncbi:energy transducer TonB [Labilibaculum sp. K2S]|uniref:energy transducer TonB n=1 Tax=Labilibaculum sp. K2S TaxID=3056386 RepID=UPI0025A3D2EA|nr:energy transducer TonB [Labilibaculum sp. K2S]MDM8162212.1 energy transducer TonB [Labilibaculum sp. K2S]